MLKKQVTTQKGLNILTKNPIILIYHFNNVSTKNWQSLKNKIKKLENIQSIVLRNKLAEDILVKLEKNGDILKKKECFFSATTQRGVIMRPSSIELENKPLKDSTHVVTLLGLNKRPLEKIASKKVIAQSMSHFQNNESFLLPLVIDTKKSDPNSKEFLLKELFQGPTLILGCQTTNQIVTIYDLLKNSFHFLFVGGLYENQLISHHGIKKILQLDILEQQKFFIQNLKLHCCSFFLVKRYLILNSFFYHKS